MKSKENKDPVLVEKVEKDLARPNVAGDNIAPIRNWRDCYDLIYLAIYRLLYPNIPDEDKELTKDEVNDRLS